MLLRLSASLTAFLAVTAPEDGPVVQRPTSVGVEKSPPAPLENPPLFPESDSGPEVDSEPTAGDPVPVDPAPEDPAKPTEPEIANLLGSDEPETTDRRIAAPADPRERVDHTERLRGYYASMYRPKSNPARVWFAARGAYSLTGSNSSVGGGRMAFAVVEVGQTWNWLGYGIGATVMGGSLTFGENGVSKQSGVLVGGGPSLGLGRLSLLGRGFVDFRVGYNFFYAPIRSAYAGLANPAAASPHGPKIQVDIGLLLQAAESRRFRHGLGATVGWQMLVHSFTGEYPRLNSFNVGIGYFFG